ARTEQQKDSRCTRGLGRTDEVIANADIGTIEIWDNHLNGTSLSARQNSKTLRNIYICVMKTTTYILIFFVGFLQTAFAQTQRLNELLYAKQFPQLQKEIQSIKLSSNNKMLYEAFVAN